MPAKSKIRKGDQVRVMTGKERGKEGRVLSVHPREQRALVEGVNVVKRHLRLRQSRGRGGGQEGGIIEKEALIHTSNLQIVCPSCGPTRVGYEEPEGGAKVRICRKCGGEL